MDWIREGRVCYIFPDHFVADTIMGADNLTLLDPEKLKALAMQDFEPGFAAKVAAGDLFVAGRNFGYAKLHAGVHITMAALGIAGVVAESFAPAYIQLAINNAYPLCLVCPGIRRKVKRWDALEVDFKQGRVRNLDTGEAIQGDRLPDDAVETVESGGLLAMLETKLKGVVGQSRSIGF